MSNVVSFVPRASAGGGWTAAERARLSELADRLSADGVKVEVVYGMTDEGDPWCVIKDDQEEVLIHVARINGQFVIHDAAADAMQEGDTLWTATDRLLGGGWREEREDVVVSLSARQMQSVIALAVAAAFIHDVQHAEAAVDVTPHQAPMPSPIVVSVAATVAAQTSTEDQRQDLLAMQRRAGEEEKAPPAPLHAEAPQEPQKPAPEPQHAEAAPAHSTVEISEAAAKPAAAPVETANKGLVLQGGEGHDELRGGAGNDTIHGGGGNDSISGGAGADHLYGGSGADTLDGGGAPMGQADFVDGGAGDDQIHLSGTTVAVGGAGADAFVVEHRPAPDGLLGVILDFSERQGDRLVGPNGRTLNVTSQVEQDQLPLTFRGFTELAPHPATESGAPATLSATYRIGVDVDGDGKEDGYLLINGQLSLHSGPAKPGDVDTAYGHATPGPATAGVYYDHHGGEQITYTMMTPPHDDGTFLA